MNADQEIKRLSAEIAALRRDLATVRTRLAQPRFERVFLAKRTDGNQWQEQTLDTGEVVDFDDGRACTSDDDPAALIDPGDAVAVIEFEDVDGDGNRVSRYVEIGGAGGAFPVKVTVAGGSAGSYSATCSLTYDLTDLNLNPIDGAVGLSPKRRRIPNCTYHTPGEDSLGVAYYDENGDIQLLFAAEEEPAGAGYNAVSSIRLNGTPQHLEHKKTPCIVLSVGSEDAGWTDDGEITGSSGGGVTTTFSVVTDVTWDGTDLNQTKVSLTFTDGLLTGVGAGADSLIVTTVDGCT